MRRLKNAVCLLSNWQTGQRSLSCYPWHRRLTNSMSRWRLQRPTFERVKAGRRRLPERPFDTSPLRRSGWRRLLEDRRFRLGWNARVGAVDNLTALADELLRTEDAQRIPVLRFHGSVDPQPLLDPGASENVHLDAKASSLLDCFSTGTLEELS